MHFFTEMEMGLCSRNLKIVLKCSLCSEDFRNVQISNRTFLEHLIPIHEMSVLPFLPVNIFCFENQIHIKTNDVYRSRFNASKVEFHFLGVHFQSAFGCFCCHFRAVCKYIKKQMIYFWPPIFFCSNLTCAKN